MTRFILIIAALISSSFGYASNVRAQDTLVLQGQVYLANYSVPLEKAQLDVRVNEKFVLQQKTDEQGNFKISGLAVGVYQLEVGLSGFRPERLAFTVESGKVMTLDVGLRIGHWVDFSIIAPDGKELQNVDPSLIGGVVKQTNGKPIRDATVVLISLFTGGRGIPRSLLRFRFLFLSSNTLSACCGVVYSPMISQSKY